MPCRTPKEPYSCRPETVSTQLPTNYSNLYHLVVYLDPNSTPSNAFPRQLSQRQCSCPPQPRIIPQPLHSIPTSPSPESPAHPEPNPTHKHPPGVEQEQPQRVRIEDPHHEVVETSVAEPFRLFVACFPHRRAQVPHSAQEIDRGRKQGMGG